MITKTAYLQIRAEKIEEAQAIFCKTIINRLLNAKVVGKEKRKCFKTFGAVIDLIKDDKLKDVISLTMRQRKEIVEYFKAIGVLEFLGIEPQNITTQTNRTVNFGFSF